MARSIWRHSVNPHILFTSVKTALLVGTVLALINHFEAIVNWNLTRVQQAKIAVTYLVPFSVATYAAAAHARRLEDKETDRKRQDPGTT